MVLTGQQLIDIEAKREKATQKKNELAPNVPKSRKNSNAGIDTQPMEDYKAVDYQYRMNSNQLRTANNKLSAILKNKQREVEKLAKTEALLDRSVSKVAHDLSQKNLELESIRNIRTKHQSSDASISSNAFLTQN